jgi:calcineurin-like phosphoesterase family protein
MVRIMFTSDTHFGHPLMARMRGYGSTDEMDSDLIVRWNSVVRPTDSVWHLGDFAYKATRPVSSYLSQLKGSVLNLIHGNHDNEATRACPRWQRSEQLSLIQHHGIQVVLCHYAFRVWPGSHHGAIHLYGHSHGNLPGDRQSLDVGVDAWGLYPVTWEQIQERLLTLPERS